MKENYLIAILTDFGLKDGFVGTMKGVILGINPSVKIVDISHDIAPQNIMEASYVLKSSSPYFPAGTIFLVVIDPGVGSDRKAIIVKTSRFLYLGPDNGVLSGIYNQAEDEVIEITSKTYFLPDISSTFHGRDIFAPVAAYLSTGISPYLMGEKIDNIKTINNINPFINDKNAVCGTIIYTDRFGNLITNLREDFFHNFGIDFKNINIKDRIINGLSNSYSEKSPGELLAIKGSSGYIEIAVNQGNAGKLLQAGTGDTVVVNGE
ncbi:MAG: SAM-dependent chlorinase/fluorinase [Candidatus Eremiobacterota bacterium]